MNNINDSYQTQLYSACILISVALADEIVDNKELNIIGKILIDFFSISKEYSEKLLIEAQKEMKKSTGLFKFGQHLNIEFDKEDKIDFISCIFEVAFADGELHYLEYHTIKKIANILNISRKEIIDLKKEIEKYLE